MALRFWSRTPAARAVTDLCQEVRHLAAAIERLEGIQRKEAEQIKKLRHAVDEGTAAWAKALATAEASASDFRRISESQRLADKERQRILERIDGSRWTDAKWRKIFNNQISALVRHLCLPLDRLPAPYALNARRFRLRSQNEEDGILFALLHRAGWGGCRFVEIGSGKSGGNSAALARDCGWAGLMIDLSAAAVEKAKKKFRENPGVTVVAERVSPDNVNTILAQHGYAGEVDLLSIDIDSYDYWIFEALAVASPRVLVLEYNALFGPERRVTVPLGYPLSGTPKGYAGASLAALTELATRKGYRLVTCENAGVNAFFLREGVAPEIPAVSPGQAFKPLRSRVELEDLEISTDIYEVVGKLNLPLVDV